MRFGVKFSLLKHQSVVSAILVSLKPLEIILWKIKPLYLILLAFSLTHLLIPFYFFQLFFAKQNQLHIGNQTFKLSNVKWQNDRHIYFAQVL